MADWIHSQGVQSSSNQANDKDSGRLKCFTCDFTTADPTVMTWHKNKKHQEYKCDVCSHVANSRDELLNHKRVEHNKEKDGVVTNNAGFMVIHRENAADKNNDKETAPTEKVKKE